MKILNTYLDKSDKATSLAVFRILFGLLMLISTIRFWANGWIEKLYINPKFHFHYYDFEWVNVPGQWTYLLFFLCGLSALCVALGLFYRYSIVSFFFIFTYIDLMDKTTYLNHYYFISILAFILIFLPAQRYFSIDAHRSPKIAKEYVPRWTIDIIKCLLAIVYIYAGLAKLNPDWMLKAMPLSIWLPNKFNIPLLGQFVHEKWLHFGFSWAGALYDLIIVFLLLWKRTRIFGFVLVVIFHVLTRALFPIGMFPFIMIANTLIFFPAQWHDSVLRFFSKYLKINKAQFDNGERYTINNALRKKATVGILGVFLLIQFLFPWRFMLYPGHLFWTEQGYRFSWRVMLMEKTGYANFKIVDGVSGKRFYVQNEDFLSAFQQKQMATQPDFILEYGHYLGHHFANQGHDNVEVYVESYAALNGRPSQQYIDPNVNLMTIKQNLKHKSWILPFKND